MNRNSNSILGIIVSAGIAVLILALPQPGTLKPGRFCSIGHTIAALPPSGAGSPSPETSASAGAPRTDAYLGGTKATGRVVEVYVKVAEGVFLSVDRAPEHLRNSAERWADLQFPELLANDLGSARAILNKNEADIRVGDVVEIKFAHKDNPGYFPVKEVTRVTELVAKKGELLAQDFERRILARNGHRPFRPGWLLQAQPAPASPAPEVTATTAMR